MAPSSVTYLKFALRNMPSALYKAIGGFATNGVNIADLKNIESNIQSSKQTYIVTVLADLDDDEGFARAYDELSYFTDSIQVFKATGLDDDLPDEFQIKINRTDYRAVHFAAAELSDRIRVSIAELENNKPNDELGLERYNDILKFYNYVDEKIGNILNVSDGETILDESKKISLNFDKFLTELTSDDRLKSLADTALIGGCFSFLAICGMPPTFAAPASIAAFAGPKLLQTFKALFSKPGDQLDSSK